MSAPSVPELLVSHWTFAAPVTVAAAAAAGAYLVTSSRARDWPERRTAGFLLGFAVIVVALESGIGTYDDRLLSVHMVQHLLLLVLAPALLLYGRPVHLALRVLRPGPRRALGRVLVTARRHATKAVCLSGFAAITLGTHIPAFFDAALTHPLLHDAEHVAYVIAGLMFWWPLLGDPSPANRLGTIGQLPYVSVGMLPMALIGVFLNRDPSLFYPLYAGPTRALGISPVFDQQQAGAIMWVAGTVLMALVSLTVIAAGMLAAERRQRALDLSEVAR